MTASVGDSPYILFRTHYWLTKCCVTLISCYGNYRESKIGLGMDMKKQIGIDEYILC